MMVKSVLIFFLLGFVNESVAQTSLNVLFGESTFDAKEIAVNREIPWDLVWGPDTTLWFTEKQGGIFRMNPETDSIETLIQLSDVHVSPKENAGLHSMCFHPNWPDTTSIYVHYVHSPTKSKLVRLNLDMEAFEVIDSTVIFGGLAAARSHNGSRLTLDLQNNILFSLGDAYQFEPAQDLNSLSGKVLRFTPWGAVPSDNPFPKSYVWSIGHRNPQGLVFADNGKLYESEHGPTTDDEINLIQKGANYGWPTVNGFCDLPSEKAFCERNNVIEPLFAFTPTAAPSGLDYYGKSQFPEFNNCLLQCFLKGRALGVMELTEDGNSITEYQNYFENDYYRLRDAAVSDDGTIYLATSNLERTNPPAMEEDDKIIRIVNNELAKHRFFESLSSSEGEISVQLKNNNHKTSFELTTFYGGIIQEGKLLEGETIVFSHSFIKAGVYWLKIRQKGRIITKLIRVNEVH